MSLQFNPKVWYETAAEWRKIDFFGALPGMIYFQPGLYVRIEQLESALAPAPKPLLHGFNTETAYLVLGGFSLSESGEAYLILSNDRDEIWFISNRHLRTHALQPTATSFRLPLQSPDLEEKPRHRANGATSEKVPAR